MYRAIASLFALSTLFTSANPAADERAAFVTTLGKDTVVLESVARSGNRLDGDIVVRVPSTVRFHYQVDLKSDGSASRATLDMDPMGAKNMVAHRTTVEFGADSVRVTIDSAGQHRKTSRAAEPGASPLFMTGFGSSFGLYSSLGLYELYFSRGVPKANDTVTVQSVDLANGAAQKRRFIGKSATQVDADYFNVAWTHLTVDATGHISAADARQTTEKTQTTRVDYFDVGAAAKSFASADKSGKGLGIASPNQIEHGTIGGELVVVAYGSPRRRARTILGDLVPFDRVWRTGANEATTLMCDRALSIGGTTVPAGTYSVWTVPKRDGTVDLIINRQHGQWGTDYDHAQDLARIPMKTSVLSPPQENFTIHVADGGSGGELRMAWDTFQWTVPVTLK
jgi:hypothetical protein